MSNLSRHQFQTAIKPPASGHDRWAIILAGGDGTRLRPLTRSITGDERPKQFCPLIGGQTLLDQTRKRSALSIPEDKTLIVVTEAHERFYRQLAAGLSNELLLVQPANKGTAPAILLSLLRIATQSPDAIVAIFPSDHYFSDDEKFMSYVEAGFETARRSPFTVTLLGITPESPEVEFGWIEPHMSILASLPTAVTRVRRFWEKPTIGVARKLMDTGCLWNSFVMVGRVSAFLKMTRRALPEMYNQFEAMVPSFRTTAEAAILKDLYSWTPETNFSHEVLAMRPDDLAVMKVDDVGWSDLGEPSRVLATLGRIGMRTEWATAS